ncbi:class I SAM-dependent methyltransferase [Orrella sp. 11846]|uniref:class I SAM-dependent methyltransferase n=1 Tax=Orrella sp. 11846 TaxID=3409913 RepID=UPI003B5A9658
MNDLYAFYANRLNAKEVDLIQSEKTWDRRAAEVSRFTVSDDDFAMGVLERHQDLKDVRVLDISFGAGRYLAEFLRRGAQISGIEISSGMIKHAIENLQKLGLSFNPADLHHLPWQQVDLKQLGWQEAFDLVFLYMTPAISSVEMLDKVLAASRHGVYVTLYAHREDRLLIELQDHFELPRQAVGAKNTHDIYDLFNLLYLKGYSPEVVWEERVRQSQYDVDYIVERYASWLWRGEGDADANRARLSEVLNTRLVDGQVCSESRDVIGHLYVDKRLKRN